MRHGRQRRNSADCKKSVLLSFSDKKIAKISDKRKGESRHSSVSSFLCAPVKAASGYPIQWGFGLVGRLAMPLITEETESSPLFLDLNSNTSVRELEGRINE